MSEEGATHAHVQAGFISGSHTIPVGSAFFQIARWRPRFWTPVAEAACTVSVIKVAKF